MRVAVKKAADFDAIIELRRVSKRFGALQVLDAIDLKLESGKTLVVIGASGTGKSVMLKHMAGLLRPDSGEVWFAGQRIDHLPEAELMEIRSRMGFLFQLNALFDSMTVGENVAFPLIEHSGRPRREVEQIVAEKLRMVGLDGIQARRPGQISGGQKKRVALARAIAMEPEVVLYDEPTTGLDPIRSDAINELILKLKRELHVTSVVVTHDMISAYKVADRMVMLDGGKIVADGTPDWFKTCDDELVRRFVDGRADPEDLKALGLVGGNNHGRKKRGTT